ncbi:hypothetical protein, partial [Kluyvera intermedia]|uniref:hypothetical protein n=2 Tax=Kluyvera intermedia TaxID=61648 RepID=UPI003B9E0B28
GRATWLQAKCSPAKRSAAGKAEQLHLDHPLIIGSINTIYLRCVILRNNSLRRRNQHSIKFSFFFANY